MEHFIFFFLLGPGNPVCLLSSQDISVWMSTFQVLGRHMANTLDIAVLILEVEAWLCDMLCLSSPSSHTAELGIQSENRIMGGGLKSGDGLGREVCSSGFLMSQTF